jgi:UDP-N-acetyl-D-mannosaminuronic acid transferase (WecB/TagA/CpsF family)
MVHGNLDPAAGASMKAPQWSPNMKVRAFYSNASLNRAHLHFVPLKNSRSAWRVFLQRGR